MGGEKPWRDPRAPPGIVPTAGTRSMPPRAPAFQEIPTLRIFQTFQTGDSPPFPCPGEAPVLLAPVRLRCLPRVLIFSPGSHAPGLGSLPPHPNHSRWDPAPAARSHRDPRAGIGFVMNPPAPVRL